MCQSAFHVGFAGDIQRGLSFPRRTGYFLSLTLACRHMTLNGKVGVVFSQFEVSDD